MSNGTAITTAQFDKLAHAVGVETSQLEFIARKYCGDAPLIEVEHFIRYAHAHGLDISAKHAYLIGRNNNKTNKKEYTIQIAIDGFRAIAEASGEYDGQDEPVFAYDEKGRLLSATVRVYRKDMSRPIGATAYLDEYSAGNSMWSKMPRSQLAKCAEALALRKAFPTRLGGSYTAEEMDQAEVRNVTPGGTVSPAQQLSDEEKERRMLVTDVYRLLNIDPRGKSHDDPIHAEARNRIASELGHSETPKAWSGFSIEDLRHIFTYGVSEPKPAIQSDVIDGEYSEVEPTV